MNFEKLFNQFSKIKVAIIGDVMLDTYWWGKVDRISPEAPVPVVALNKKEQRIGGAGNVAFNLRSLDAAVTILSVLGNDADGEHLIKLFLQDKINTQFLIKSKNRITTNKIRIISRNQHMMRLDAEVTNDIDKIDENKLIKSFKKLIAIQKPDVVIFEDYNKGVLTKKVINEIIYLCKLNNIITTVDPKRNNFFEYKDVDIFKPNLKEVLEGLNIVQQEINISLLKNMHTQLNQKLHHKISLITLSENGVFYQQANKSSISPTHIRTIADVSGAGDTVIAVASLVFAVTKNISLMAEIANIAGGLVCEEVGTVAINKQKLLKECIKIIGGNYK